MMNLEQEWVVKSCLLYVFQIFVIKIFYPKLGCHQHLQEILL